MPLISVSWEYSFAGLVSTVWPSRRIVTVSAMLRTSPSLWEMKMMLIPLSRRPRTSSKRFSESSSGSGAVGSSRMRILQFLLSALAISTSCCCPMPKFPTLVLGFTFSFSSSSSSFALSYS